MTVTACNSSKQHVSRWYLVAHCNTVKYFDLLFSPLRYTAPIMPRVTLAGYDKHCRAIELDLTVVPHHREGHRLDVPFAAEYGKLFLQDVHKAIGAESILVQICEVGLWIIIAILEN